jgi:hypothetical protein
MEEAQREERTWREVKRLAADTSRWKASWKPFAPIQGAIGNDDDDDDDDDDNTFQHP